MLRNLILLVSLFFLLTVAACGGDDDSSSSGPTSGDAPAASSSNDANGATTDDAKAPSASSGGGGVGVVEVDGQTYDINEVQRCKPFFDGEDNLDLQALASDGIVLFVTINTPLGAADQLLSHELSIQGSKLGSGGQIGAFSGAGSQIQAGAWLDDDANELPGAPFTIDGDRISGSMKVVDARGSDQTLDVTFDIPIPSDIMDC